MKCSNCMQEKELIKGRQCRDCKNKKERIRRSKIRSKINKKERERYEKKKENLKDLIIDINKKKICTVCKEEKTLDLFYLAKKKGTIRSECKSCASKWKKQYYEKNKKEILLKTNIYKKDKYKNDHYFKLKRLLRCRLYYALKSQNAKKSNRTLKLTGCSLSFLVGYLEGKFRKGMTWENYGEWHVDHIKPVSSFNLLDENEQKKCFNYNNLQPLWAKENLSKGNTILSEKELKKLNSDITKSIKKLEKLSITDTTKLEEKNININKEKRKCKKAHNQNLPKYIYYRESHGGKYKGYVVEHPKGSKRFGKSIFTLEENLKKAKEYIKQLN